MQRLLQIGLVQNVSFQKEVLWYYYCPISSDPIPGVLAYIELQHVHTGIAFKMLSADLSDQVRFYSP